MALLICLDCTAAFAVGVARCPNCGSERSEEQGADPYRGDNMPKINAAGEATFAADIPDAEGGEEPSQPTPEAPGTSSPTSTEKPPTSPETSSTDRPKRARTTGSRSKKTPAAEDSSAASTDTGGPATAGTDEA